jgi:hypothetical protein
MEAVRARPKLRREGGGQVATTTRQEEEEGSIDARLARLRQLQPVSSTPVPPPPLVSGGLERRRQQGGVVAVAQAGGAAVLAVAEPVPELSRLPALEPEPEPEPAGGPIVTVVSTRDSTAGGGWSQHVAEQLASAPPLVLGGSSSVSHLEAGASATPTTSSAAAGEGWSRHVAEQLASAPPLVRLPAPQAVPAGDAEARLQHHHVAAATALQATAPPIDEVLGIPLPAVKDTATAAAAALGAVSAHPQASAPPASECLLTTSASAAAVAPAVTAAGSSSSSVVGGGYGEWERERVLQHERGQLRGWCVAQHVSLRHEIRRALLHGERRVAAADDAARRASADGGGGDGDGGDDYELRCLLLAYHLRDIRIMLRALDWLRFTYVLENWSA